MLTLVLMPVMFFFLYWIYCAILFVLFYFFSAELTKSFSPVNGTYQKQYYRFRVFRPTILYREQSSPEERSCPWCDKRVSNTKTWEKPYQCPFDGCKKKVF